MHLHHSIYFRETASETWHFWMEFVDFCWTGWTEIFRGVLMQPWAKAIHEKSTCVCLCVPVYFIASCWCPFYMSPLAVSTFQVFFLVPLDHAVALIRLMSPCSSQKNTLHFSTCNKSFSLTPYLHWGSELFFSKGPLNAGSAAYLHSASPTRSLWTSPFYLFILFIKFTLFN